MLISATTSQAPSVGTGLALIVFGILLVLNAIRFYRDPLRRPQGLLFIESRTIPFAGGWFGAAVALAGAGVLLNHVLSGLGDVFDVIAIPFFVIGVVGIWWMPRRLLPAQFVESQSQQRARRPSWLRRTFRGRGAGPR